MIIIYLDLNLQVLIQNKLKKKEKKVIKMLKQINIGKHFQMMKLKKWQKKNKMNLVKVKD